MWFLSFSSQQNVKTKGTLLDFQSHKNVERFPKYVQVFQFNGNANGTQKMQNVAFTWTAELIYRALKLGLELAYDKLYLYNMYLL